jgi:hypothetical protein
LPDAQRSRSLGCIGLMRPCCLRVLASLGLLGLVVSERAKVLSAARLVAIHPARRLSFETGRRWYRPDRPGRGRDVRGSDVGAVDSPEHARLLSVASPLPPVAGSTERRVRCRKKPRRRRAAAGRGIPDAVMRSSEAFQKLEHIALSRRGL